MTESFIPVQGTGLNLETSELTDGNGIVVHREGVFIGDPTNVNAKAAVDEKSCAAVTIESEHFRIHQGEGYTVSGKASVAGSGGEALFLFDNTNGTYPHFREFSVTCESAPMDIYVYEAPTVSARGTPLAARNNNRNSANTPVLDFYSGPTVSANGLELEYFLVVGTKQSGGSGGTVPVEWILKPATKYLIRVVNNSTSTSALGFHAFWYESAA